MQLRREEPYFSRVDGTNIKEIRKFLRKIDYKNQEKDYELNFQRDKKSKSLNEYGSDQVILSKLKIILILLISLISSTYQTTLAEYSFPSIAVTTIPSAVNPGTQPQIQFPSVINSGNFANDPSVSTHGLEIAQQKYIVISAPWVQTTNACTEINFWLYWRAGVLDQFGAVSLQNINGIQKYLEVKAEGTASSLNFNLYYGGQVSNVGTFKQGWHLIAFGLCSDYLFSNLYKPSSYGYALSEYVPGIGNYVPPNSLYIGCMTCTDVNTNYIIHSIRILTTNSSTVFNPASYAVYNPFSYCGDGVVNGTDSCDDLNLVSGDGCSDTCAIESGYRCGFYTSGSFQICDLCGNGQRFYAESCDDGNLVNGDGCSSYCYVETGWYCSGNLMALSSCSEYCGDGKRFNSISTYCDDYNTNSGDGCSSSCTIETGWTCSGGTTTSRDYCYDICGDGRKYTTLSTFCDDGNTVSGDGCSSTCVKETGWTCSGGSSTSSDVCTDICGDGKKYTSLSTFCDDANLIAGDGCSSTCSIESGWTCAGGSSTSKDTCTEICGDGIRFNLLTTYCDDGNSVSGDGCSSACAKESGWLCSGGSTTTKDVCTEICGDGKKFNNLATYCDDGNSLNGDGCSLSCAVESGWGCTGGNSITKDTCNEICGDGIRFNILSTYCDDGNSVSGDGCSSSCSIESGWLCSGGSTITNDICTEICGDSKRFNSLTTYCDDGNLIGGDGCNSGCSVESGWTCSGGNSVTKDTCSEICGDGIRFNTVSTYCDDANTAAGDGCNNLCTIESGWICTGGSTSSKDTCSEICGDGKRFNSISTYCDDGNFNNGDGCTSGCSIESGWLCSGGTTSTQDICTEICGDGKRYNSFTTYCDDGNKVNGDGCSSVCAVETGYVCSGGTSSTVDTCSEKCGDGIRFNSISTYCDDSNVANGDGCSSTCGIESGWTCSGGSSTTKDICIEVCGDGKRFNSVSTYCDDGNKINGDGCSSTCAVETYWSCSGGSSINKDTCIELCGDGKRFNSISTYCDDGNTVNNDGCSSTCSIESGWTCSGGSSSTKDTCSEICGDGKRFNSISTYCDDGNSLNGDGCSSSCAIEAGWTCSGGTASLPDTCLDICGDGKKYGSLATKCDDGNKVNGDGCSMSCNVETGWSCSGGTPTSSDTCSEICGDGIRFNSISTYCDDGNTASGDGCTSSCVIETGWSCGGGSSTSKDICIDICGDGKKYSSASNFCDDGNILNNDGCNSVCVVEIGWACSGGTTTNKDTCTEICGDGIRFNSISTYCDDGNLSNNDGCNSSCQIESGWTCFGGTSSNKDTCNDICGDGKKYTTVSTFCDDGNKLGGDGCSSSCLIESGWTCSGGSPTNKDTCSEICGDGIRFNVVSTYCDDGNIVNNDGCSSSCVKEVGWSCSGGTSSSKDTCTEICGDGIRFNSISTYCDDGNISSGDGCSSSCVKESGWICSGGTSTSKDICAEICGDGIRFNSLATYCDDGNTVNGDGCNSSCSVETGYTCTGGTSSSKDTCFETCGDGIRYNSISTYCDDGNKINGDGCSSICAIEFGWFCFGGSPTKRDICTEVCGDGTRVNTLSTYCDDGNNLNGDGCSMACGIEHGWKCDGGNLTTKDSCSEVCGDGIRFNTNSTYCDDGDLTVGDGCNSSCAVETGWECSGGNSTKEDICSEICGDGKKFNSRSSYCDDGNVVDGDGCSSKCKVEPQFKCSGGNSTTIDVCLPLYIVSTQEAAASSTTQAAVGVGTTLSAGTSLMTMSSPVGIFSMMNQFQMLLLIIISGVYLSDGVKATITGMGFSMLNFDFLKLEKIDIFGAFINFFSFDQTNEGLSEIGITSGNAFVNVFKLLFLVFILIIVHILTIPIMSKCRNAKKESLIKKCGDKLFYFLTYAVYVRLILQSYLIIVLSAISEIAAFVVSDSIKIASFIISCALLAGIILFFIICWYQIWKAHPDITLSNQIYFIEFFNGLKNTTQSRLFPAVYMLQRILSVVLLLAFVKLNPRIKISFLALINLISTLYLLIVRPYVNLKDLLLDCLSQILVTCFSCMLIYFTTESKWNANITWVFIGLIMISTLISTIISIIDLIMNIKKIIQKCKRTKKVTNENDNTKVEITQNDSYISKMQTMVTRMQHTREEYKIDCSESDPTLVNIQLDIEHPKPALPIINRRYIIGR